MAKIIKTTEQIKTIQTEYDNITQFGRGVISTFAAKHDLTVDELFELIEM